MEHYFSVAKKMSHLDTKQFDINLYYDYERDNETYQEIALSSPFQLNFIKDQKNVFEDELKDYGYLDFPNSNGNILKIVCENDRANAEINKRVNALLAMVSEEQLLIPSDLFDEVKETPIQEQNIHVYFDKENLMAHIFSFDKSAPANYKKKIQNIIEEKYNTNEEVTLEQYKLILLFSDFFPSKIFPKYKKVKINLEGSKLVFCGFSPDIKQVVSEMYKYLAYIKFDLVRLPKNSNEIIMNKSIKQYLIEKIKKKEIHCSWEINSEKQVCIYSTDKNSLNAAKEIFKESILELNFLLTGPKINILQEDKWKTFLKQLSSKYMGHFYIHINKNKLTIVTTDQTAPKIKTDLEQFFDTNAIYRNTFPLKLGVYNFLQKFEHKSISKFCKDNSVFIDFENDQEIHILGTKQVINKASSFLTILTDSIIERQETFTELGFKKFLQSETADTVLEKISKSNECIILKNEEATNTSLGKTSIYQIKYANCEIILQLKDITELKVDAIVNPSNKDLKHIGGLSRAIIQKGLYALIIFECCKVMWYNYKLILTVSPINKYTPINFSIS